MIDYKSEFGYVPNLSFSFEQHLKNYAECEENARRLLESFHIIREKMEVNLRPIIALFPHYSEHNHEHSENIISAIEKLLGKFRIEKLSPSDTWMILVCAYMHDLGMLVQGKELEADWNTCEFQDHIQKCMYSYDDELKDAAINVTSIEFTNHNLDWPVHIYRDVILLASEFYRRKHPERTESLPHRTDLKQSLNIIMSIDGKIPPRIQDVIGKICLSHGLSFANMLDILEPTDSLLGYVFHPRFIAAMLCLGDLCDLDNGRFNTMAIEVFGGLTKNNLIHYYKHESVKCFVIQKDIISVTFDIPNMKIKQELKNKECSPVSPTNKDLQDFCDVILLETQNWITWMEDIVQNIKLYWSEFNFFEIDALSPTLNYKILVDGQSTISSKKNMRFSFSNDKAYELIESYSLYNNKYVFIRELLQNSIDALKRQFWIDILSGRWNHLLKHLEINGKIDYSNIQPFDFSDNCVFDYYQIKIYVEHNEKEKIANFIIEDNGTGISKDDVQNRIIRTGKHDDLYDEIKNEMPQWLKPTSAFGIGLHSVFAVTDTLFAQTQTEYDRTVYNINMHSGKLDGYIFMSISEQQDLRFCNCTHGTRMEFSMEISDRIENQDILANQAENPMDERPESNFCRILQKLLTNMLGLTLFDITYKFNNDKSITCNKLYKDDSIGLLFKSNRRNKILGKIHDNDYYDFALNLSGDRLILWDRRSAVLMEYYLGHIQNTECTVYCKGFTVENAKIVEYGYNIVPIMVDYWGGETKDILNVSRDKLTLKQMKKNKMLFMEARTYRAEVYYILLQSILADSAIKKWHSDIAEFIKPWVKKKNENIEHPDLSKELSKFLDKYNILLFSNHDLELMVIRHGFCALLKLCKEQIKNTLNLLDNKEKIKYIFDFQLINKENDVNNDILERTCIIDFIETVFEFFENKADQRYIYELFFEIFKCEFADEFINYSSYDLYKIVGGYENLKLKEAFGEIYISLRIGILADSFVKSRTRFFEILKREEEGFLSTPLDIYLCVPLIRIVYLLICTGVDVLPLRETLSAEFSYIPGYDNNYGFINVNNVSDIIIPLNLKIKNGDFTETLVKYFPLMHWLSCEFISIDSCGKLLLQFGNEFENMKLIYFKDNSFGKLLNSYSHSNVVPAPMGYEKIAIDKSACYEVSCISYHEKILFYGNYRTYLWDDFSSISKKYSLRLASGEDKELIANEIMPSSRTDDKPIINLLRYIYHNRVYNNGLSFEEAWQEIYETYRKFVLMVLDCII